MNKFNAVRLPENRLALVHDHSNGTTTYTFIVQLTHRGLELAMVKAEYTLKPQLKPRRTWEWGQAGIPQITPLIRNAARDALNSVFVTNARVGV